VFPNQESGTSAWFTTLHAAWLTGQCMETLPWRFEGCSNQT
jgi:hypothetical protein